MFKRVNIFGGPGTGKSTFAASLFAELKKLGHKVELVTEAIKPWAYQNKKPKGFDQFLLLAEQMKRELDFIEHATVITDSPLLLNYCFATRDKVTYSYDLRCIIHEYDSVYRPVNFYLTRKFGYSLTGRYEEDDIIGLDSHIFKIAMNEYLLHVDPTMDDAIKICLG